MMAWLIPSICAIVGFILGLFFMAHAIILKTFGTIKSVDSEDGPYLYLDLDRRPEDMAKHTYVVFKVGINKDDTSQK